MPFCAVSGIPSTAVICADRPLGLLCDEVGLLCRLWSLVHDAFACMHHHVMNRVYLVTFLKSCNQAFERSHEKFDETSESPSNSPYLKRPATLSQMFRRYLIFENVQGDSRKKFKANSQARRQRAGSGKQLTLCLRRQESVCGRGGVDQGRGCSVKY